MIVDPKQYRGLDTSDPGVKAGAMSGDPIVDRDATARTTEPGGALADVHPGECVEISGESVRVQSTGQHAVRGGHYLHSLGFVPNDGDGEQTTLGGGG